MSKKYIKVENTVVEVTEEIYREYYKMDRQERYQVERDREKGTFSYNSLDLDDMQGEELLHNPQQKSIEDQIELKYMMQALGRALKELSKSEKRLIDELYFKEKSLRCVAKEWDVPLTSLFRQHEKILKKLKTMLD